MAYDNNSDSTTLIYQKAGTGATIDYSSLALNPSIADTDQLVVIRRFTPSSTFKTTAAPDGFGGVYPDGQEWWDIWTLKSSSSSGSPMYTVNTTTKQITISTTATDYYWTRTNADGTTSVVHLPVFDAQNDDVIVMRKTYALDNFVNWMAGTRITSKNLNLNSDQLLHLLQELVSNFRREDLVNPFVGAASGICPLDSSGFIPAGNVGASSLTEGLAGITFTAGDGLSGGGTLAANRTFAVDLDDTIANGLSIISNKLGMGLGTSLTKAGNLVDVYLRSDGGLINDGGVKADAFTTLDSVTTSTTKLVTSSVVKELKDDVDSLGTGVRFLGGLDPQTQSTATLTMADGDALVTAGTTMAELQEITLIDNAASPVTKTYVVVDDNATTVATGTVLAEGSDYGSGALGAGHAAIGGIAVAVNLTGSVSTQNAFLVQLKAAIEHANGHNGGITVSAVPTEANGAQFITLTQANADASGNTTVTMDTAIGNLTKTNFVDGTDGTEPSTPAGGFKAGDTFDVLHDGFTSASWTDSSWATLAVTQGHDVRYNGTAWESIPPVSTIDLSAYLRKDGTTAMTGQLNTGSNAIVNVPDAANDTTTELQNAASKNFVINKAFALTPLDGMKDVADYTTPTAKSILVWNFADTDNNWKTKTLATISVGELDDFDMTTAAPTDGDVLSWDGSNWVPSSAYGNAQVWSTRAGSITGGASGAGDGVEVNFTLNSKPSSTNINSFVVALDGVLQVPGQDFVTVTAGSSTGTLTFATGAAPPYGAEITVYNTGKLTNLPPGEYVSTSPSSVPLTITGHASQSANLQEWKDSGGNILSAITAAGKYLQSGAESLQILQMVIADKTATEMNRHASGEYEDANGDADNGISNTTYYTGADIVITPKSASSTLVFFGSCGAQVARYRTNAGGLSNTVRWSFFKNFESTAVQGQTVAGTNTTIWGDNTSHVWGTDNYGTGISAATSNTSVPTEWSNVIYPIIPLNFALGPSEHGSGSEEKYHLTVGPAGSSGSIYNKYVKAKTDRSDFFWICFEIG